MDQSRFIRNSWILTVASKPLSSLAPGHLSECLPWFSCSLTHSCHTGLPACSYFWYTPYTFPDVLRDQPLNPARSIACHLSKGVCSDHPIKSCFSIPSVLFYLSWWLLRPESTLCIYLSKYHSISGTWSSPWHWQERDKHLLSECVKQ